MTTFDDVSNFMSSAAVTPRLRVLVPLDGSADAERALTMLAALAMIGDLHVAFVSVVDDRDIAFQPNVLSNEQRLRQLYLDQQLKALPRGVVSSEAVVRVGRPITRILEEADRVDGDVILLSNKQSPGSIRWFRGSIVDKAVRDGSRNVLVLGKNAPPAQINSIMLPLDGSGRAESAVPVARELAEQLNAALHIVRVVSPLESLGSSPFGQVPFNTAQMTSAFEEIAEQYIERIGKQLRAGSACVLTGPAAESLLEYVEQHTIGLVVMTPHGRTGPVGRSLGSVTDRMLDGGVSVLVVKKPLRAGSSAA